MATYTYPGVYMKEVSSGVRPIAAAGTSTAAFVGIAERGDLTRAVKVYNFTEFQKLYGGFLDESYLAHGVYQYFNNGGSECYVVRIAGAGNRAASINLNDRNTVAAESLVIGAISPGRWGNDLAVVVTDGTRNPGNEFDLYVYDQNGDLLLESFSDLSMVPSAGNFVEKAVATSSYITVLSSATDASASKGSSKSGVYLNTGVALTLSDGDLSGNTKFQINIDSDGYQEVDLEDAVTDETVTDLNGSANIRLAIETVVKALKRKRNSTGAAAFSAFTCNVDDVNEGGEVKFALLSGTTSLSSSVKILPAATKSHDASSVLKLGLQNGGVEVNGSAVTRPVANYDPATDGSSPDPGIYYLVGDHDPAASAAVKSVLEGLDGDTSLITAQDYIDAFSLLDEKEDVSILAAPGVGDADVVGGGLNYCASRPLSDCFFVADTASDDTTVESVKGFMDALTPKNSYGALYAPWIKMLDPTGKSKSTILVPPSGYVAGLYAKTDGRRGVWKSPAGTSVALAGASGLAVNFTDVQQGNLNPKNINVIRSFASSGIVLWGARSIASDPEYGYIAVRRMAIMLRVSIFRGIQWAVFEPNDTGLWRQLSLNIESFMMGLYRQGAFQGSSPSEAFFVKCDGETTTQGDIDRGIVNVVVGFAPLKPAEFVVVTISQKTGQG